MSTFTINMSLFFVLSFTAMYSEDVLGISSALMSFKHIENDFLYRHIHIYNIYFFITQIHNYSRNTFFFYSSG